MVLLSLERRAHRREQRALLVPLALLAPQALRVRPAPRVRKARWVPRAHKVHRAVAGRGRSVHKAQLVRKVRPERLEAMVHRVPPVPKVRQEFRVPPALRVLKVSRE